MSEASQKSYCDEEPSKATEKKEDLEPDVAKLSSKLEAAVARSTVPNGEISALHSELGAVLKRQWQMHTVHADERNVFATAKADLEQESS